VASSHPALPRAPAGCVEPRMNTDLRSMVMSKTKPRLFYFCEGMGAWVPVTNSDKMLDPELDFFDDGEIKTVKFQRIDMTDEEFDNLPDG